jgi:hypothetical protein
MGQRTHIWRIIAVSFVGGIVFATYVLSYALLVEVKRWNIESIEIYQPSYRVGGKAVETLFRPVHWCDRQIRPERWDAKRFNLRTRQWEASDFDRLLE